MIKQRVLLMLAATALSVVIPVAAQAAVCTLAPGNTCSYQFTNPGSIAVSVPFGSITASEAADGSKISFAVSVSPNYSIDTGSHEAFSLGIGNLSGTPIPAASLAAFGHIANIVGNAGLGIFSGDPGMSSPFGDFEYALTCSATGGSSNCGQSFSFDFIFATANSGKLIPSTGDSSIWFAADICVPAKAPATGCSATGVAGATAAAAVPGPVVGAGLPGLVIAWIGLVGLARRRRRNLA